MFKNKIVVIVNLAVVQEELYTLGMKVTQTAVVFLSTNMENDSDWSLAWSLWTCELLYFL